MIGALALCALGPASSTQLLDEPGVPENGELRR